MFWKRSTTHILAHWQSEIDNSLEIGQAPLFDLGYSNQTLENLQKLWPLQHLNTTRTDLLTPTIVLGGNNGQWVTLSLLAMGDDRRSDVSMLPIVFAGADLATRIATLTTHGPPPRAFWPASASQRQTGLPYQFAWLFAPKAQPDTIAPWETQPFQLLVTMQKLPPADDQLIDPHDWTAWTVFAFCIALILLALVL